MSQNLKFMLLATSLILTGCGPDELTRCDKPITYAQAIAKHDINFPFPASRHDIYYGIYGDWQAFTLLVRFEAPVQDCLKHIDTMIAWDDKMGNRTSSYPRVAVTHVDRVDAGNLKPAPWFAPDTITNGIYAGTNWSHTPQIWVDLEKGVFYFKETD